MTGEEKKKYRITTRKTFRNQLAKDVLLAMLSNPNAEWVPGQELAGTAFDIAEAFITEKKKRNEHDLPGDDSSQ